MTGTICLFNDRVMRLKVSVQSSDRDPCDHKLYTLEPTSLKYITYEIPEGSVPFIKVWENGNVFVSYVGKE